jgi:hypothetical protein
MRQAYTLPPNVANSRVADRPLALDKTASNSVVQQVNSVRGSSLRGINSRPLPQGNVAVHPDGAFTIQASNGRNFQVRRDGTVSAVEAHGVTANFRSDGTILAVHSANMHINYGPNGAHQVTTVQPDHSVVVSTGPRQGYVQRTMVVNNQTVVQRTYLNNNVVSVRTYTSYAYHGVPLQRLVVPVYYPPAFYGWVYYPWRQPVVYRWGFYAAPWYGYYGGYFSPAPAYPTPSLWLADYTMSQTLSSAYQDRQPAGPSASSNGAQADTPISDDTRQRLADLIRGIVVADTTAAANKSPEVNPQAELPGVVQQPRSVFVVASNLDVTGDAGECGLTPGDILEVAAPVTADALTAETRVVSSKKTDCPASTKVTVSMAQLQEMYNELHQHVEKGMEALRETQGTGGIPAAPQTALVVPPSPYDATGSAQVTGPAQVTGSAQVTGDQLAELIDRQEHIASNAPQVIQDEFGA